MGTQRDEFHNWVKTIIQRKLNLPNLFFPLKVMLNLYKVKLCLVYSCASFDKCIQLHNHHHNENAEQFHCPPPNFHILMFILIVRTKY